MSSKSFRKTFLTVAMMGTLTLAPIVMATPASAVTAPTAGSLLSINQAASTAKTNINISSKTTPFGKTTEVRAAASSNNLGYWTWSGVSKESGDFYLQEKKNGKWVNLAKVSKTKASNGTWNLKYSIPVKKAGTTSSYRLNHPATSKANAWTGTAQNIRYKADSTDFYEKSGALWSGVQKRWTVNRTDVLTNVQVLNGAGRTVYLQKYDSKKKKWFNVSSAKLNTTNYAKGKVTVPKVTSGSTVTYRVHIPANSYYAADTSASIKVKYEDPRKYTGFAKSVYSQIKKYCPNIIIEGANKNGKWDGIAYMNEQRIKVVYGLSAGRFKKVSLHECAHIIQGNVYGQDYNALTKAGDKIYGKGKGVEHMADCMAYKMGADPKYYSYTNNCKGTRGTAAAKVLSGKRI